VKQIDTGSKYIHRFDDALRPDVCRRLETLARSHAERPAEDVDLEKLPWFDSDTFPYADWQDADLRKQVGAYRIVVCQLICLCFREVVFPHFTDLVLWRPGKKMKEHKDDGYEGDDPILNCRHYSAVTYCNDDYRGGETFIRNEHDGYYTSTPKLGSIVFYPSDERATHGVNEVLDSDRVTLSTWFTKNSKHYEP
jgi:hypothetical protein